jgi:hypothetical protein
MSSFGAAAGDKDANLHSLFHKSFMKQSQHSMLWLVATLCILLASCSKAKLDQSTPSPSTNNQAIQEIQQLFTHKQYDNQVNPAPATGTTKFKWAPQWKDYIIKDNPSSGRDIYVPLEAYSVENDAHPIPVRGAMEFLRFHQVAGKWTGTLFTCFYKLPKGDISSTQSLTLTGNLLHSFTGDVCTKKLDTGETLHSKYQNGVWQKQVASNGTDTKTERTSSCKTYYYCLWQIYCDGQAGSGGQAFEYMAYGESCDEPTYYTLCGYETKYKLETQNIDYVCDDPSDPQPTPEEVDPNHPFADGIYTIGSFNADYMSTYFWLAIDGASQQSQAFAIQDYSQSPNYRNPSIRWRLTFNSSDNTYTIQSVNSGLMLDTQGGSSALGTPIWQYPANGSNTQKWKFVSLPNSTYFPGRYVIMSNTSSLLLQARNGSSVAGAVIELGYAQQSGIPLWQWWRIAPN